MGLARISDIPMFRGAGPRKRLVLALEKVDINECWLAFTRKKEMGVAEKDKFRIIYSS